jgi:hypothetical protein
MPNFVASRGDSWESLESMVVSSKRFEGQPVISAVVRKPEIYIYQIGGSGY